LRSVALRYVALPVAGNWALRTFYGETGVMDFGHYYRSAFAMFKTAVCVFILCDCVKMI